MEILVTGFDPFDGENKFFTHPSIGSRKTP